MNPVTPFTSPSKQISSSNAMVTTPIFRSGNDTLREVYKTPRTSGGQLTSPSPSPRKRGRSVIELEDEDEDTDYRLNREDSLMIRMETELDDEDNTYSTPSPTRPIRRPRKFAPATQSLLPSARCETDLCGRAKAPSSGDENWKEDMFNQPF